MKMRLKLFHEAKAPLANGHRRDTLLLLSDEEFENNHGFIQWAVVETGNITTKLDAWIKTHLQFFTQNMFSVLCIGWDEIS